LECCGTANWRAVAERLKASGMLLPGGGFPYQSNRKLHLLRMLKNLRSHATQPNHSNMKLSADLRRLMGSNLTVSGIGSFIATEVP
jgi:hypothetical protein